MRRAAFCVLALLSCAGLSGASALPAQAQASPLPPHAWLFGAWIGGIYPPPVTLGAEECLGQPVVIFTRDLVLRATITDLTYTQRTIETARATATGAEFRFLEPVQPPSTGGNLFGPTGATPVLGFGCETTSVLHVIRHGENQISFPHCSDFPYPLIRCPGR